MADKEACENKVIDELGTRDAGAVFMRHESDGTLTPQELREEDALLRDVRQASARVCNGFDVDMKYAPIPGVRLDAETGEATPFSIPNFNISVRPISKKEGVEL